MRTYVASTVRRAGIPTCHASGRQLRTFPRHPVHDQLKYCTGEDKDTAPGTRRESGGRSKHRKGNTAMTPVAASAATAIVVVLAHTSPVQAHSGCFGPTPPRLGSAAFANGRFSVSGSGISRVPSPTLPAWRRTTYGAPPLKVSLSEPSVSTNTRNGTVGAVLPSYLAEKQESEDGATPPPLPYQSFWRTLWQFSRPHTLIGSALCIPTIAAFAAPPGSSVFTAAFLRAVAVALVPALLINLFVTGLNQVTDVEIDRVNKPELPIAAGRLSMRGGVATVLASLLGGVGIGLVAAPAACGSMPLLATLVASAVIGTAYSMPPVRLKRFPSLAAVCILTVRGSVINIGFYAHARAAAFGLRDAASASVSAAAATGGFGGIAAAAGGVAAAAGPTLVALAGLPSRDVKCALLALYFALFGVVIALMKDVPDVEGDRLFGIPSFSVKVGQQTVFQFARRLMSLVLCGASATLLVAAYRAAAIPLIATARASVAAVAAVAAQVVRRKAAAVRAEDPREVYSFYMFLWKVFYASYLVLPLAR